MFDPAGHGEIELMTDGFQYNLPRRATRTATLDGGAIMDDAGFTVADAVLTIKARRLRESERLVKHLQQYHNRVCLSANEGFFVCGGMSASFTAETITIRLLPLEGTL
jgi:hypothetical protein